MLSIIIAANTVLKSKAAELNVLRESLRKKVSKGDFTDFSVSEKKILLGASQLRMNLVAENIALCSIVRKLCKDDMYDDCFNEAYIALDKASWYYNKISIKFSTYAVNVIKREIRRRLWEGRFVATKSSTAAKLRSKFNVKQVELNNCLGRKATFDEVIAKLKWRQSWVDQFVEVARTTFMASDLPKEITFDVAYDNQVDNTESPLCSSVDLQKAITDAGLSDLEVAALNASVCDTPLTVVSKKHKVTVRGARYAIISAKKKILAAIKFSRIAA